jgi:hypothetical protein
VEEARRRKIRLVENSSGIIEKLVMGKFSEIYEVCLRF